MDPKIGLKYKCTNLTELRDEAMYGKLKQDTQHDYLLFVFLYNIVCFHLPFALIDKYDESRSYLIKNNIEEASLVKIFAEVKGFKDFINSENNRKRLEELKSKINPKQLSYIMNSIHFFNMFKLYDETFNNRIILEKLCGFKINDNEYYSIIFHFIDKIKMLKDMSEPTINSRSIIIKNFHIPADMGTATIKNILPFKISNEIEYQLDTEIPGDFFYNFDDRFKSYILKGIWDDGYDFYWKEPTESTADMSNCLIYLVEILDPENQQIISMTVTRSRLEKLVGKQVHYYIKKNVLSDIKSIVLGKPQYRNVSLLLHSFATSIFNANAVFSDLMSSMRKIFEANGIEIGHIGEEGPLQKDISEFAFMCSRGASNRIAITEEFRNMWKGTTSIVEESVNEHVKMYKVVADATAAKNKYFKYKAKYLELKKLISEGKIMISN